MNEVVAYIIGVLIFLLGVGLSIGLHEVGHMWPAKAFGARVSRYMIGFGPTIFSRKKGETEYGIKLLPLGGYVAISGMLPPERAGAKLRGPKWFRDMVSGARQNQELTDGDYDHSRAFYRLPVLKRVIVMLGGPFMNLFLAIVFFSIVFMGMGSWQQGVVVERVYDCVIPADGKACAPTDPIGPAKKIGLQAGDKILSMNGVSGTTWDPFKTYLLQHPRQTLHLVVERNGKQLQLSGKPYAFKDNVYNEYTRKMITNPDGTPKMAYRGVLGISLNQVKTTRSAEYTAGFIGTALSETASTVVQLPNQMIKLVQSTFGNAPRDPQGVVSVVGVGQLAGNVAQNDNLDIAGKTAFWLMILGSLNLALFAFNLIPLLPLDGGHVLNALVDGARRIVYRITGRGEPAPLDTAKMVPFTMAMWFVLMGMGILSIFADFIKPIAFG